MKANWFWADENGKHGPKSLDEIVALIGSWDIGPDTLVWHPILSQWTKSQVEVLSHVLENQVPPPLPDGPDRGRQIPPPLPEAAASPQSSGLSPDQAPSTNAVEDGAISAESHGEAEGSRTHDLPWFSAKWARRMLFLMIGVAGISLITMFGQIQILSQAASGGQVDMGQAELSDRAVAIVGLLWFFGYIVAGIVFIRWQRQVYDTAFSVDPEFTKYNKYWTIWGWVIPIGFLYIPYRIIKEAWTAFDPDQDWSNLLGWWWFMWLTTNALSWFSLRRASAETLSDLQITSWLSLLSDVVAIVAAGLGTKVVYELTIAATDAQQGHAV